MNLYWGFDLDAVVARLQYAAAAAETVTFADMFAGVTAHRRTITARSWPTIPL